jgi:vesicle transport protein SEC22
MSIVSGKFVFSYMVRDNLCFLTMTESSYPKRVVFLYLDEVADVILGELAKEYGNEVRGILHAANASYDVCFSSLFCVVAFSSGQIGSPLSVYQL